MRHFHTLFPDFLKFPEIIPLPEISQRARFPDFRVVSERVEILFRRLPSLNEYAINIVAGRVT